jgi:hypothetical protein
MLSVFRPIRPSRRQRWAPIMRITSNKRSTLARLHHIAGKQILSS